MFERFLIPKSILTDSGSGNAFAVDPAHGQTIQLTLEITSVIEQQSIEIHLEGSEDGTTWAAKPLAAFPQKFYVGASVILCDLSKHPEAKFLRATWKTNRWGRGDLKPRFELYLFAESIASVALDSR